MASQKMSSRQKMINMMYLVLTAMLALNVSAEILQAFDSLRKSIADSAKNHAVLNEQTAASIIKTVDMEVKAGAASKAIIKEKIMEISAKTGGMLAYLEAVVKDLEAIAQPDPATGELKMRGEQIANYRYWMGSNDLSNQGRGEGKAVELRGEMEKYLSWANSLYAHFEPETKKAFRDLTLDPADDPSITDHEAIGKTWEYMTFHNKPVVADLAMVEKFKEDIQDVETILQQLLRKELNPDDVIIADSLLALEAPFSTIVAAGMPFTTKIFVGMAADEIKPEFMGSGIKTDPGGNTATMTLLANGSVIPDGKSEGIQSYTAMIKVPKKNGEIMELPLRSQFTVRRPEVVVRSKVVNVLMRDCANTVTVDVPALGDFYSPDFSRSTGGQAVRGETNKEVTLIPTGREFNLSVYSNTNGQNIKIENIRFEVQRPPSPSMRTKNVSTNTLLDGRKAINRRQTIKTYLEADEEFRSRFGKDSRYRVTKVKLMLQESVIGTAVTVDSKSGNIMDGISFDLSSYPAIKAAPRGAKIYVEIEEVKRVNFQGKEVPEPMPITERLFQASIE